MTLTSTLIKDQYNGDGATTAFPTSFVFWDDDDLEVIHTDASNVETVWTRGTHYTVSGGDGATGTVTVSTSPVDYTPAAGTRLTIRSALPNTQPTSLPAGGPFPSASVERRFDQNVRLIQQLAEEVTRTIQLAVTSTGSGIVIPDPEASKFLRWDAAADNLENADISAGGSIGIPVTIAEGGTGATTATGARASLGLAIGTDVQADLDVPSQAEAEAGAATTERVWTAQRVSQAVAALAPAASTLPRSYLSGLILSQAADTDHDVTVAVGVARGSDDDEDISLTSAITKQIDATWASGDDAGGLSSSLSAPANNTWYHVFAINVGGSADVGFDTSVTAANLIADHSATAFRRIGSVLTDGSANIISFSQHGNNFLWTVSVSDFSADPGSSENSTTLTVPPDVEVVAMLAAYQQIALTGNVTARTAIYHPDVTGSVTNPVLAGETPAGSGVGGRSASNVLVKTDASAQIQHISEANVSTLIIKTIGWLDDLGRFE